MTLPLSGLALAATCALSPPVVAAAPAAGASATSESELVSAFLDRDAPVQRQALLEALRESARLARQAAPAWRIGALREESRSASTAFTTEAVSLGVELDLGALNGREQRRAAAEAAAAELESRSERIESVTRLRALALAAWSSEREAALRHASAESVRTFLSELERLVAGGEHSRFDLERLRAVSEAHDVRARLAAAEARSLRSRLSALVGKDVAAIRLDAPSELPPADELVALVLASHPRLAALRERLRESELGVDLARGARSGALDLRAGLRRDDAPGVAPGEGYELEAVYTFPAFSLRRRDAASARTEQAARELELVRAEQRAEGDVRAARARLEALGDAGTAGSVDVEALHERGLRRYRAGEAELTELVDVLAALAERELLELGAEIVRRTSRIELDRATGLVTAPDIARLLEEASR